MIRVTSSHYTFLWSWVTSVQDQHDHEWPVFKTSMIMSDQCPRPAWSWVTSVKDQHDHEWLVSKTSMIMSGQCHPWPAWPWMTSVQDQHDHEWLVSKTSVIMSDSVHDQHDEDWPASKTSTLPWATLMTSVKRNVLSNVRICNTFFMTDSLLWFCIYRHI